MTEWDEALAKAEDAIWSLQVNAVGFVRGMGRYEEAQSNADNLREIEGILATLTREKRIADRALVLACEWTRRNFDAFPRAAGGYDEAPAYWAERARQELEGSE